MTTTTAAKWTEDRTNQLLDLVGGESPVSKATVESAAATLETTVRSVASKLRKLGREVASTAKTPEGPKFSAEDAAELRSFIEANANQLTYADIAAQFKGGQYSAKSIQGKALSLELTGMVKPAEKVEVARTYTEAEEGKFISLANANAFIEDIAAALGKSTNSVRGKALSLLRSGSIASIPKQRESTAKDNVDPIDGLDLANLTVAEIAQKTNKTERGIKTLLTRRGLIAKDYDGAAKKAKAADAAAK